MKKIFVNLSLLLFLLTGSIQAQNTLTVSVRDAKTDLPLIGANVYFPSLKIGTATNAKGNAIIKDIPYGKYVLTVSYIGYEPIEKSLVFPLKNKGKTIVLLMNPKEIKGKQVVITSTRTNGVETHTPIKVEVLGQEEVNEEVAIRPSNVSKLLGETSGVIVQQTSGVSGAVSFRLEGLPGIYTQLLTDGLPMPSKFSSGLTLLQIPPLDLRQIEVVKGASSVFYGNGAIAGFVNIITKKPAEKPEFDLVVNQTSLKGTDFSSFYSRNFGRFGITLLTSQSFQQPVDVDHDGFTDIPFQRQSTIHPKLFFDFDKNTRLTFGINAFFGNRTGGDLRAIETGSDSLHYYYEKNKSTRFNTELIFSKKFNTGGTLSLKNNIYYYTRRISINAPETPNIFAGKQIYSFSELSYVQKTGKHYFVGGLNFVADNFNQTAGAINNPYNYSHSTAGAFLQDDWRLTNSFILQPGIRVDREDTFGTIILPHLSMLYKFTDDLHARFTYGSGYKNPNYFDFPIVPDLYYGLIKMRENIKRETANGFNLDFGYKYYSGDFVLKINQAFFYGKVKNSLIAYHIPYNSTPADYFSAGTLTTKGFDTNLYLSLDELELFADYTYTDVQKTEFNSTAQLPLTPKNKANFTLTYEEENEAAGTKDWRAGLEAFYTGKQYLPNMTYSRSYWLLGAMAEKMFNGFSVILNVENILNERQSKYGKTVVTTPDNRTPDFNPIYMPIDGIVANIAVWVKLR